MHTRVRRRMWPGCGLNESSEKSVSRFSDAMPRGNNGSHISTPTRAPGGGLLQGQGLGLIYHVPRQAPGIGLRARNTAGCRSSQTQATPESAAQGGA